MSNVPLLCCHKLSKSYQNGSILTHVLNDISFTMQYSEMIAITGNSGSGKSTLLHLLGGLDTPTSGKIILAGQSLNMLSSSEEAQLRNQFLGFIYQFHYLLPDFTALENVAMPLLIGGTRSSKAKDIAREMLSAVGLEKRSMHRPAELSGGEKQRIAIARALVNHPSLVLADEPTGSLDQYNTINIFELLSKFNITYGTAFLIATHDFNLANRLQRKIKMQDGRLL